jgi:chemotaxis protein CheY-P-specific phosphatase CheC
MSEILTEYELDVTRELLNIAFANSADSFSAITKQTVLFKPIKFEINQDVESFKINSSDIDDYVVLETSIIGHMSGKSYLLFDQEQAEYIHEVGLPKGIEGEKRKMLEDAILLEIDNMLAAAVITEFSNLMSITMYGGVPAMQKMNEEAVNNLIKKDLKEFVDNESEKYYIIKTNLTYILSKNSKIKPQFVWIFSEVFINAIKDMVGNKKHHKILEYQKK